MAVNQIDYVELELVNQRLDELRHSIDMGNQQMDHSIFVFEWLSVQKC